MPAGAVTRRERARQQIREAWTRLALNPFRKTRRFWVLQSGNYCEFCAEIAELNSDGVEDPFGQFETPSGNMLDRPPAHTHCKCTVVRKVGGNPTAQ